MDLLALEDFNLVALHGGFGKASRASHRPKASLSRHVVELEQALGARLVDRGARTLRLTDEGRALHERTSGLLAELKDAGEIATAGAATPRGRLRISAPVVFAHVVLSDLAVRFARDYPEVRLEIVAEDRIVDLVEDDFDLVVRIDPKGDDRLHGRRILGDERMIVAAFAPPRATRANAETTIPAVLRTRTPADVRWRMRAATRGGRPGRVFRPEAVLRLSSLLMVRDAVLTGVGAALLPRLLVADDVASGRLVLWGFEDKPPVEIWALQTSHRLIGAKVRAFLDALTAAFPDKDR